MGSPAKQLELLLTTYLAVDSNNSLHTSLPFVLSTLTAYDTLNRLALITDEGNDDNNPSKDSPAIRAASALHKWSTRINTLLTSKNAVSQWVGSVLVRVTVMQATSACQKEIRGWCNGLLSVCKVIEESLLVDVVESATVLFVSAKAYPALQRDLNQMYLAKLVAVVCDRMTRIGGSLAPFLRNLRTLIRTFPNALRSQSDKIEIICLQSIARPDSSLETIRMATSTLLDLVRADKDKSTARAGESKVLDKICISIDEVVDAMCESVEDGKQKEEGDGLTGLVLPALDGPFHEQLPTRVGQLDALGSCMCTIIDETITGFSVPKVTDLVRRIYSIATRVHLSDGNDAETQLLRLVLPTVCIKANDILRTLLSRNIFHDFRFVKTIVSKSLDLSQSHSALRLSTYSLITRAIDTFSVDFVHLSISTLSKELTHDIQLGSANRRAAVQQHQQQPQNKKRKLVVTDTTLDTSAAENWDIKLAALNTSHKLILLGQSHAINTDNNNEDVSNTDDPLFSVLQTVLSQLLASATTPQSAVTPWADFGSVLHAYQYGLLNCVVAAMETVTGRSGDILPLGVRLVGVFLWHPDMQIRELCKHGLVVADLAIHPRLPRFEYTSTSITTATKTNISPMDVSEPSSATFGHQINTEGMRPSGKRRLGQDGEEDEALVAPVTPAVAAQAPVRHTAPVTSIISGTLTDFAPVARQPEQQHQQQDPSVADSSDEEQDVQVAQSTFVRPQPPALSVPVPMDTDSDDGDEDAELPEINLEDDDDEDSD
ncbi:hypothetical protein PhCBS80983_g02010 [Powellomyces hirtus]|uniref:Pre-rRNA-processing protein RIX1 n=1 Tax=Powellomyces hirtus TaxID=109895 RepID=A0A507EAA8_9FUNG|nr:hypothetical protein PhCBS80983_g02010 [Powellomyces hirtus]